MKIQNKGNKFCLFLLMVSTLFIFSSQSLASKLHVIIAADTNDKSIGEGKKKDLLKLTDLFNAVSNQTGMKLNLDAYHGNRLNYDNLVNALNNLSPAPDDVAVFYYSGHGYRETPKQSQWPYMCVDSQKSLDLDTVISIFQGKSPRFFMAVSDSCNNYSDSVFSQNFSMSMPKAENYQNLFLNYRGDIIASGSVPGEYGWSNSGYGGLFTHAFLTSLYENLASPDPSWDTVMKNAQYRIEVTDKNGKKWLQHPQAKVKVELVKTTSPGQEIPPPLTVWISDKTEVSKWDEIFPNTSPPNWNEIFPPTVFLPIWDDIFPQNISRPNWNGVVRTKPGEIKKKLWKHEIR